ncbi:bifunctional UDP-N-acetylmuramoyl-tripeptide:D-alanyl-D-alanine ligase/alanine racemase [Jiulongibacter sediminis]|uniref:Alanine racemase n=1 Tax=Jiulongibacter sediminis TaxID=1605367 RepID=A0A0P7C5Y5_9BACT|nr:bifunctional UDP-N-acetylmuramoyl-tripeptide:D-alanyl-D-alanine ligase/alanine racemase [Jiulongibacter sediminis]KPM47617.1 alanine racemase [Jiulongibacter sediminis]TBX23408.1 alanine racemase [Jiulongibacter sediminis]
MKQTQTSSDSKILLTDSRFLSQPGKTVFVAIEGERHNGHDFIEDLISKGVSEFIVSKKWAEQHQSLLPLATFTIAENTTRALQKMARKHRETFEVPVVGITGSNGKTIVKEWLSSILQSTLSVIKSPRSYNSQIGVPLSVWQMSPEHEVAIFEAGISQPAEMQALSEIIQPEIGLFTNIGSAHNEGFRSQKQKITEKLRLFRKAKTLIYSIDYPELDEEIRIFLKAVNPKVELIPWSKNQKGSITVDVEKKDKFTNLRVYWKGDEFDLHIPFVDDASIENCIHCFFAAYLVLKKTQAEREIPQLIQNGFDTLKPVAMRLELKEGINNCYLIDDSYNNDFGGLEMALNFMNQHHINRRKCIILSDVLQSGLPEKELYKKINDLLEGADIQQIIGIGPIISRNKGAFEEIDTYLNVEEFLKKHPLQQFANQLILVKGARNFAFEKIVNALTHKVHGTALEVNLDAITHNLNYYRGKIADKTKLMVMVKASAYGSGSTEVASLLQYHRVDYLAVAYTDEGVELRENGIELPIMVLNPQPESFKKLVTYALEPEIYSLQILKSFIRFLDFEKPENISVKIHLKIDTGMKRLGFIEEDLPELLKLLKENPTLKVGSIFSHLAASDSKKEREFTKSQISSFSSIATKIQAELVEKPIRHILNTAGIVNYPEAQFEMVRLGIGLYGVDSSEIHQRELETTATLKTTISQIKKAKAGETIGYGRVGKATNDMTLATIAIGYADGFDRKMSNGKGFVYLQGHRCPTIGNVCMDMTMIDITGITAEVGDQVEIFGKNISIFELAEQLETIPYEILTKVGSRVKRVFFKE